MRSVPTLLDQYAKRPALSTSGAATGRNIIHRKGIFAKKLFGSAMSEDVNVTSNTVACGVSLFVSRVGAGRMPTLSSRTFFTVEGRPQTKLLRVLIIQLS